MGWTTFLKNAVYLVYSLWTVSFVPSPFTQRDDLTEGTYAKNAWDPGNETVKFSYTSNRVLASQYNAYKPNEYVVFGYYTDWSQYDARLQSGPQIDNTQNGRGNNLMAVDADAYDKIIIGFAGIVGDRGPNNDTIMKAATAFHRAENQTTFLDPWGDVLSYENVGFTSWMSNDAYPYYDEKHAQGVLGGLVKMKKEKNPNLILSFSIGGWTMSEAFRRVSADANSIEQFSDSVVDVFKRFPSFTEVDIDWEYPNAPGIEGQPYGPEDPQNFANMLKNLKAKLRNAGRSDVLISVAVAGTQEKLKAANVPLLLDAGVYGFNVMTYDYFGTPWATELAHHTNLYSSGANNQWSVDKAVQYLLSVGVPSRQIFIGFAGYSRNAKSANITSVSPLRGSYAPGTTSGTFESGTSEFHDVLYNYLDLSTSPKGKNNFTLYTDEVSDADFLYSAHSGLFLSLDTPRTTKAKAEYVKKHNLGGMFTWTIESDRGALVNAAREGLGQEILQEEISMQPYYAKGMTSL